MSDMLTCCEVRVFGKGKALDVNVLLENKHAPLVAMFFPLLSIVAVEANMAKLIDDGCYSWFSSQ